MFMRSVVAASAVVLASLAGSASGQVVFFSDFSGPGAPSGYAGSGTSESVQGYAGLGVIGNQFQGNLWRNDTVAAGGGSNVNTLTLNALPAHNNLSIGFLLAIIDSWDGLGGTPGPDGFEVTLDGNVVFSQIFAIQSGSTGYVPPVGGLLSGPTQLGFSGSFNDAAYDLSVEPSLQNIAHSSSTAVITFRAIGAGWQGGSDESWGIDNLQVSVVPTPGAAALLGLAGLAGLRRRR